MVISDSELPRNRDGRFYHIDCSPGDIAPYVLACGDQRRAERVAELFDAVEVRRHNREFLTITGKYKGIPMTVMATGIGPSATAIALIEAAQCSPEATFIRVGTCGAVRPHVAVGDLVITESVIREENTTHYYAPPTIEARANAEVVAAIVRAVEELGFPWHKGTTCTTSDFYAGQGRVVPGFPALDPNKVQSLCRMGVLNLEMEMSVYLTLAQVSSYRLRAGGLSVAVTNRIDSSFASPEEFVEYEMHCIQTGLRALEILAGQKAEK